MCDSDEIRQISWRFIRFYILKALQMSLDVITYASNQVRNQLIKLERFLSSSRHELPINRTELFLFLTGGSNEIIMATINFK